MSKIYCMLLFEVIWCGYFGVIITRMKKLLWWLLFPHKWEDLCGWYSLLNVLLC